MFEKYTESARRAIFFARYEASQFRSQEITTEHLLLGVLREAHPLMILALGGNRSEAIRKAIKDRVPVSGEDVPISLDLPLSEASKNVLRSAAQEAEQLKDAHVGTEHLLLGLLSNQKCLATQILGEFGLNLATGRERIRNSNDPSIRAVEREPPQASSSLGEFSLRSMFPDLPTDVSYRRAVHWIERYIRKAESLSGTFHWERRPSTPRDALRHRQSQRLCLYLGQSYDAAEFDLIKGGWTHDHCVICWVALYQPNTPQPALGYTNGQDWLCPSCYERLFAQRRSS